MVLGNLIFQAEQRFGTVVLPHHDQQASDDRNQTEHGRMLSSNMLLLNLILLIDVTFSTPTPVCVNYSGIGISFPRKVPIEEGSTVRTLTISLRLAGIIA